MSKYLVTINGVNYEVEVAEAGTVSPSAAPAAAPAPAPAAPAAAPRANAEQVTCPMPGTILRVCIQPGQKVKSGDLLFILEAMKMENELLSPCDGTVAQVHTAQGAMVKSGDLLAVIE